MGPLRPSGIHVLVVDDRREAAADLAARLGVEPGLSGLSIATGLGLRTSVTTGPVPDVLLVDHFTLARNGASRLLDRLRAAVPGVRVLILTRDLHAEAQLAWAAAGAVGCLDRDLPAADIAAAVRRTGAGDVLFSPEVLLRMVRRAEGPRGESRSARPDRNLTAREREVLEAIADGLTAAEAAERLMISPHTVRSHRNSAVGKLEARSTVHAVVLALRAGEINSGA